MSCPLVHASPSSSWTELNYGLCTNLLRETSTRITVIPYQMQIFYKSLAHDATADKRMISYLICSYHPQTKTNTTRYLRAVVMLLCISSEKSYILQDSDQYLKKITEHWNSYQLKYIQWVNWWQAKPSYLYTVQLYISIHMNIQADWLLLR